MDSSRVLGADLWRAMNVIDDDERDRERSESADLLAAAAAARARAEQVVEKIARMNALYRERMVGRRDRAKPLLRRRRQGPDGR